MRTKYRQNYSKKRRENHRKIRKKKQQIETNDGCEILNSKSAAVYIELEKEAARILKSKEEIRK